MKKGIKILIILIVILIVIIAIFFGYRGYKLNNNPNWCMINSDCGVSFSSCFCDTFCKNIVAAQSDCMRACDIEESKASVKDCECAENRCAPR